jgi:hypothetical protein
MYLWRNGERSDLARKWAAGGWPDPVKTTLELSAAGAHPVKCSLRSTETGRDRIPTGLDITGNSNTHPN